MADETVKTHGGAREGAGAPEGNKNSIKSKVQIEDKVAVKYYLASYNNFSKWKTLAHLLFIDKIHIIA